MNHHYPQSSERVTQIQEDLARKWHSRDGHNGRSHRALRAQPQRARRVQQALQVDWAYSMIAIHRDNYRDKFVSENDVFFCIPIQWNAKKDIVFAYRQDWRPAAASGNDMQ